MPSEDFQPYIGEFIERIEADVTIKVAVLIFSGDREKFVRGVGVVVVCGGGRDDGVVGCVSGNSSGCAGSSCAIAVDDGIIGSLFRCN